MNEVNQKYFLEQLYVAKKKLNIDLSQPINSKNINNLHYNKRCFIIGTAPTINNIDLSKIKNDITFGLNSIVSFFTPDYFVAISNGAFIPDENIIHASKSKIMFLNHSLLKQINNISAKLNFTPDKDKYFIYFADNPSKNIISSVLREANRDPVTVCNGSSCLFPAIQFARVMGCNPIYLLGVMMQDKDGGHDYFNGSLKKKSISAFNVNIAIKTMEKIVKEYDKDNIRIISATPNCLFVKKNIISGCEYSGLF